MKYGIKTAAQAALLAVGIVMVCLGVYRNEVATVLSKAIKLYQIGRASCRERV